MVLIKQHNNNNKKPAQDDHRSWEEEWTGDKILNTNLHSRRPRRPTGLLLPNDRASAESTAALFLAQPNSQTAGAMVFRSMKRKLNRRA